MSQINALIAQGGGEGTDFLRAIYQGQQMAAARRQGEIQDVQLQKALREEERAQGQLNALAKLADQYQAAGDRETAGLIRAGGSAAFAKLLDQKMDPKAGYMAAGDVLYDLRGGSPKPVGGNIPMVNGQPYAPGLATGGRGPVPAPGGGGISGALAGFETGGEKDPNNAANPNSTAVGPHQFLERTWLEQLPKHAPGVVASLVGPSADLKDPATRAALLDLRRNPDVSDAVAKGYAQENTGVLRNAGIEPTPANLLIAHFLGGTGATRFLQADPNAVATSVVSPDAVMANRNVFFDPKTNQPRTVGQLRQMAEQRTAGVVGGPAGGAAPPAQGQPQPSVTPMTDTVGRPYTKDAPTGMMWGRDAQGRMVAMPIPGSEDRTQTLSPAEVQALGFPKGSVVQRDGKGKLTVASNGEGGPFTGNGMEAQALNTLITGDPATPEYAAAYAHMTQPKIMPVTQADGSVQMMAVAPQLPPTIRQPTWMQGGASPAASPATSPQQSAAPSTGAQPAQQGGGSTAPGASAGLGFTVTTVPGTQPRSPKFTEGETNAYGFYQRMRDAEKVIRDLESQGTAAAGLYDRAVSVLPDVVANWAHTEPFQKLDQARRDFINAQLRKESGAAIGQDEFNNAYRQYFPQSGDAAAVIDQKRANRANAIDAMMKAGKSLVDYYDGKDGKGASPAQGGGVEYDWDPGTKTLKMRK